MSSQKKLENVVTPRVVLLSVGYSGYGLWVELYNTTKGLFFRPRPVAYGLPPPALFSK